MSIAAFACHGWSLVSFFNKLSSYILHFTVAEMTEIFAFMMAFAFLESIAVTMLTVLLSAVLPPTWLKEGFALKTLVMITILTAASLAFQHFLTSDFPSLVLLLGSCILPIALIGLSLAMIRSYPGLKNILHGIEDRLSIMIFIFGPLGFLSLIYIVTSFLL